MGSKLLLEPRLVDAIVAEILRNNKNPSGYFASKFNVSTFTVNRIRACEHPNIDSKRLPALKRAYVEHIRMHGKGEESRRKYERLRAELGSSEPVQELKPRAEEPIEVQKEEEFEMSEAAMLTTDSTALVPTDEQLSERELIFLLLSKMSQDGVEEYIIRRNREVIIKRVVEEQFKI